MKSIRTYLLLTLLATITLVVFISLLKGYQASIDKAHHVFDEHLRNMAEIIRLTSDDVTIKTIGTAHFSPHSFFQVWSEDHHLIRYSTNAPPLFLSENNLVEAYSDVNISAYRYRIFTLKDTILNRWIVTGERADIRYNVAEEVVLAAIFPIVLSLPILGLMVWFIVGFGLKPLGRLSLQLSHKQANDLSPIVLDKTPSELTQLMISSNALLSRLNAAFSREKQFSANAAHELRTPISALKVQLHNLYQHDYDIAILQPIAEGIERMSLIIEQILSLYRHSPDHAMVQKERISIHAITQQIIVQQYDELEKKQQKISLMGEGDNLILANKFAIETLVKNLLENASKYSPQHSEIMITLSQTPLHSVFCIEDSGAGIDEKEYQRVFERFYRVDGDQHSSGTVGCGLGLAIVKHIIKLHDADIHLARSEKLGGLKIVIHFPQIQEGEGE